MHAGANAYSRTAQAVADPRDLEAQLLLKAATGIQAYIDGKVTAQKQIVDAINYNLKVWRLFSTAVGDPKNLLPDEIKGNVTNLGVFVIGHSLTQLAASEIDAEALKILVTINRELAAGLRGSAAA
ncbi:MAG: flagellar biosynthesis regulator FlaF [Ancalomicrobiaceae bacterium]|nr:flagellar biosynthesis regulator FlaF [Ancalomicrobiaceae bacterium]